MAQLLNLKPLAPASLPQVTRAGRALRIAWSWFLAVVYVGAFVAGGYGIALASAALGLEEVLLPALVLWGVMFAWASRKLDL